MFNCELWCLLLSCVTCVETWADSTSWRDVSDRRATWRGSTNHSQRHDIRHCSLTQPAYLLTYLLTEAWTAVNEQETVSQLLCIVVYYKRYEW